MTTSRSKLPAEGLAEGAVLVWDLFPQQPASVEGARNLALPAQEETEKIQCCWLAALSPLLPTQGCAQGTETLLSAAPGPAIQGAGGGRRSQKEALNELQRQSHLLHSFTDHLPSTCCVHGTETLWDEFEVGFRHELHGGCRGRRLGVTILAS